MTDGNKALKTRLEIKRTGIDQSDKPSHKCLGMKKRAIDMHTNLEMWTGDTLGQLLEQWDHDFGELGWFYHI